MNMCRVTGPVGSVAVAPGNVPGCQSETDEATAPQRDRQEREGRPADEARNDRAYARKSPQHVDLELTHPFRAPFQEETRSAGGGVLRGPRAVVRNDTAADASSEDHS